MFQVWRWWVNQTTFYLSGSLPINEDFQNQSGDWFLIHYHNKLMKLICASYVYCPTSLVEMIHVEIISNLMLVTWTRVMQCSVWRERELVTVTSALVWSRSLTGADGSDWRHSLVTADHAGVSGLMKISHQGSPHVWSEKQEQINNP